MGKAPYILIAYLLATSVAHALPNYIAYYASPPAQYQTVGQDFTYSFTVENIDWDTDSSTETNARAYPSPYNRLLITPSTITVPGLRAYGHIDSSHTGSVTARCLTAGDAGISPIADYGDLLTESVEDDNIGPSYTIHCIQTSGVDLTISQFKVPANSPPIQVPVGDSANVRSRVHNGGVVQSQQSTTQVALDGNLVAEFTEIALAPGQSGPIQVTSVPCPSLGMHTMTLTADSTNSNPNENNENNNQWSRQMECITRVVDLSESVSGNGGTPLPPPGSTLFIGSTYTASAQTHNNGPMASAQSTTRRVMVWNNDLLHPIGIYDYSVPQLAPDQSQENNFGITCPGEGVLWVRVQADAFESNGETNENNNMWQATYTCSYNMPDLRISDISNPETMRYYSYVPVRVTTTNSGAAAAGASVSRFWLDGALAATIYVPPLGPGDSFTSEEINVRCMNRDAGAHFSARADFSNTITESNEDNNLLSDTSYCKGLELQAPSASQRSEGIFASLSDVFGNIWDLLFGKK